MKRLPMFPCTYNISRGIEFPTKLHVRQRRLRSACTSAQSKQSLRCPPEDLKFVNELFVKNISSSEALYKQSTCLSIKSWKTYAQFDTVSF